MNDISSFTARGLIYRLNTEVTVYNLYIMLLHCIMMSFYFRSPFLYLILKTQCEYFTINVFPKTSLFFSLVWHLIV